VSDPAGGSTGNPSGTYQHGLRRAINTLGNVAISVSGITPTASVFIIAPVAFAAQGTGTFWAFVIAGVIGIGMAMCWGELGSAFPVVGGSYSLVSRVLGRPTGFVVFVLVLVTAIIIPSSIALGAGQYLSVIWPGENPNLIGAAIMVVTAIIAMLTIELNARVTGLFLSLELLVVLVVTILGFTHVHQSPSTLIFPHTYDAQGHSFPLALGAVLTGVATAVYAYNGYDSPIIYSEETRGPQRNVARAVFWSLTITVAAELIPVVAALLAAPSLAKLTTAATPMQYMITAVGGSTLNTIISLGVALAIFNATLAIILGFGRILYSSGRDRAWPEPISGWMAAIHPRFRTPWVATAFVGLVGAVLTAVSSLAALVTFTGVTLVVIYALIALSAVVSRVRQRGLFRPYRMPLWPLPPLVALAGLVIVATQQTLHDVAIVAGFVVAALLYYVIYLRGKQDSRWVMLAPTTAETEARSEQDPGPADAGTAGQV
jgi:amino acid transporter